jgi:hypothetical protein
VDPAKYPIQCPYACKSGTYILSSAQIDDLTSTAPCDPSISTTCIPDTWSCDSGDPLTSQIIRQCARGTGQPCEAAEYVLEEVVYNIGGASAAAIDMTIASSHSGALLYVSYNTAIYSMSTFQRQPDLSLPPISGNGMTLVAGNSAISGRVDSSLGASARFYQITSMMLSEGGKTLLLLDTHYVNNVPMGGWLRSIDVTTNRDYPVTTLSAVKNPPVTCADDTFLNPVALDVLSGTPYVLIVDAECYTIHTYNVNTGLFVRTAGTFRTSGTGIYADGDCLSGSQGLLEFLETASWTSDGNIWAIESWGGIRKISHPNTLQCRIDTINSDAQGVITFLPWPGDSSLFKGGMTLESDSRLIIVGGGEVRLYDTNTQAITRIAGYFFPATFDATWVNGAACAAVIGMSPKILRHHALTHGGDSSIYMVNTGLYAGTRPSIWRLSMPCPTGWYWSGNGLCTRKVPGERCELCSNLSPTCAASIVYDVNDPKACDAQGTCLKCYGLSHTDQIACNNGPSYNGNYRYTASPPINSPNQTVCTYSCFNGYYGYACYGCPYGVCPQNGTYRRPCNDLDTQNNGACLQNCTPKTANARFTGGSEYTDTCPYECIDSTYYKDSGGICRSCSSNSLSICQTGYYMASCTSTMDSRCLPCSSILQDPYFTFTGHGITLDDPYSCPFQ